MKEKTCCFTGHRKIANNQKAEIKKRLENTIQELFFLKGINTFLAGGALGFDTLAAQAVLSVREKFPEIKLKLYFPCLNQRKGWSNEEINIYEEIKNQADEYRYISEEYSKGCMQMRNRALVDDSSTCICYLNREIGGTAYTVNYAKKKGLEIINLAK